MAKRDTYNYNLKKGNKIVYKGTTKDLDKRAAEHEVNGKDFTKIEKVGRAKTPESASKEEAKQLETYRKNNGGKNPKYNKTDNG